mmetsp:Transcript_10878/g.32724  ORF Transcript_10878/g.32724 Transcript_10878/m.32724 type:complete len:143 (-) Transcript_10878:144-572(-)
MRNRASPLWRVATLARSSSSQSPAIPRAASSQRPRARPRAPPRTAPAYRSSSAVDPEGRQIGAKSSSLKSGLVRQAAALVAHVVDGGADERRSAFRALASSTRSVVTQRQRCVPSSSASALSLRATKLGRNVVHSFLAAVVR